MADLLAIYKAFRANLKGGECSLTISDPLPVPHAIEPGVLLNWELLVGRKDRWRYTVAISIRQVDASYNAEWWGLDAAYKARAGFARQFPDVREPAASGYSDTF